MCIRDRAVSALIDSSQPKSSTIHLVTDTPFVDTSLSSEVHMSAQEQTDRTCIYSRSTPRRPGVGGGARGMGELSLRS
eukprot:14687768-Alexandrium_andersonii.AAC.1